MDDTVASFDVGSDDFRPDVLVVLGTSVSITRVAGTLLEDLFGRFTGVTANSTGVSIEGLDEANIATTGADLGGDKVLGEKGSRDDVQQQNSFECAHQ